MMKKFAACLAIALMTVATSATAQQQPAKAAATAPAPKAAGDDRYIGYYYPKPTATETFESTMQTIDKVERA